MKKREMKYIDYGMTDEDKIKVRFFCGRANSEEKEIIKIALAELPEDIAPHVYRSLTENMSYDDICKQEYIYRSCVDFYAYRRQGMGAIKRQMIMHGIWDK